MVKREFSEIYDPDRMVYDDFDDTFTQLRKEAEARAEEIRKPMQVAFKPVNNNLGKKIGQLRNSCIVEGGNKENSGRESGIGKDGGDDENLKKSNGEVPGRDNKVNGKENGNSNTRAFDVNKLQKLSTKGAKKTDKVVNKEEPKKKIAKEKRVWDDKPKESKLDFTDPVTGNGDENISVVPAVQAESMMDTEEIVSSESESEEDEDTEKGRNADPKKKGWFSLMIWSIAGKTNLEKADLEPELKALKDRLMTKNVAGEVAEKLCESVAASLEGKNLSSFTRISSTVQTAMEAALLRILTPSSIDIKSKGHDARKQLKPYVVVFVGVNGVGKSTNLAKAAYWLQQHYIKVMLAACDTFRSGAVEQLRTLACRLKIPIFQKGYEKDPKVVAQEAIQEASQIKDSELGADVVLVDTAGRMQDNEPLMRALSNLINAINPDLVLFVGEALVGNDGVDQLSVFDGQLAVSSPSGRGIDGILLTKFNTIDDKVGAAVSMSYKSGKPVMFVGCGQSYTDLKSLNVKSVVKTLLKRGLWPSFSV